MRLVFAVLLLAAAVGCAPPSAIVIRETLDEPAWAREAMRNGAAFFAAHTGVDVSFAGDGIPVDVKDLGTLDGRPVFGDWNSGGHFLLSASLDDLWRDDPARRAQNELCTAAHEVGHAFGLEHVADRESLMAPVQALPADVTACYWSAADEDEAARR